jgi:FtsK/SpoIIIE family
MTDHEYDDGPGADIIHLPGSDVVPFDPPEFLPATTRAQAIITTDVIDTPVIRPLAEIREWAADCADGLRWRRHKAAVHLFRTHLYVGRAARFAGRGSRMAFGVWWRWVRDVEALLLRREVAVDASLDTAARAKKHQDIHEDRMRRVRVRWAVTGAAVIAVALAGRWLAGHQPILAAVAALAVLVALGVYGAEPGQIVTVVDVPVEVGITPDRVIGGFVKAGITKPGGEAARILGVPHPVGDGHEIHVAVPEGTPFAEVAKKRHALASGMGVAADCLELDPLERRPENELMLYVSRVHPLDRRLPEWPLLTADRHNLFRPFVAGWDSRGNPVTLQLMWLHTLVGAAPRKGKSTILRLVCTAVTLDPRADLIIVDFAGGLDFAPFEPVAKHVISGPTAEHVEQFSALLDRLQGEYERRMAAIKRAGLKRAPQNRVTEAMAATPEFRPIVVVVDEFQVATMSEQGKDVVRQWSELMKVCPKAGIVFVAATQNADQDAVPTTLRNIMFQRVSLSVATYQASMAILGNEAQARGLDAAELGGAPGYAIAWGSDSEDGPGFKGRFRTPNVSPADAEAIADRVAVSRGAGVPVVETAAAVDVGSVPPWLMAVLDAWPAGQDRAHLSALADAVGMDKAMLSHGLRTLGLAGKQTKVAGVNATGYRLADVQALAFGGDQ